MSGAHDYRATVRWQLGDGEDFVGNRYSRGHQWHFDGGTVVPASSAPQIVPVPLSVETAVDPEEAFVASLSSCHMLFFLAYAAKQGWIVERYEDAAVGTLDRNAAGRIAMTQVRLRPRVAWGGTQVPDEATVTALHERAHQACYIANSVNCEITIDFGGAPE